MTAPIPTEEDERQGLASASKMDRYKHCPGSWNAEKNFSQDDDEDSEARTQGDDVHEAFKDDAVEELDGTELKRIATGIRKLEKTAIDTWAVDLGLSQKEFEAEVQTIREERYWIKDKDGNNMFSAQPDLVMIHADSALVLDYKTGYKPVPGAARNMQIRSQALAVWKNFPNLRHIRGGIAAYRLHGQLTEVDYELSDLFMAQKELNFILWRMQDPDAERVPGDWCHYCPAKANCPQAVAYGLIGIAYLGEDGKIKDIPQRALGLNLRQLAAVHVRKSMAEHIFKAVHNRLRQMSDTELASVKLKKVKGRMFYSFKEQMLDLYARMVTDELCTGEEFIANCSPEVTKFVELISPRIQEKSPVPLSLDDAGEKLNRIMREYATAAEGAPSVKKMSKEDLKKQGDPTTPSKRKTQQHGSKRKSKTQ